MAIFKRQYATESLNPTAVLYRRITDDRALAQHRTTVKQINSRAELPSALLNDAVCDGRRTSTYEYSTAHQEGRSGNDWGSANASPNREATEHSRWTFVGVECHQRHVDRGTIDDSHSRTKQGVNLYGLSSRINGSDVGSGPDNYYSIVRRGINRRLHC